MADSTEHNKLPYCPGFHPAPSPLQDASAEEWKENWGTQPELPEVMRNLSLRGAALCQQFL